MKLARICKWREILKGLQLNSLPFFRIVDMEEDEVEGGEVGDGHGFFPEDFTVSIYGSIG